MQNRELLTIEQIHRTQSDCDCYLGWRVVRCDDGCCCWNDEDDDLNWHGEDAVVAVVGFVDDAASVKDLASFGVVDVDLISMFVLILLVFNF